MRKINGFRRVYNYDKYLINSQGKVFNSYTEHFLLPKSHGGKLCYKIFDEEKEKSRFISIKVLFASTFRRAFPDSAIKALLGWAFLMENQNLKVSYTERDGIVEKRKNDICHVCGSEAEDRVCTMCGTRTDTGGGK